MTTVALFVLVASIARAAGPPAPADLMTRSFQKVLAVGAFHYRATGSVSIRVDRAKLVARPKDRAVFLSAAAHPLRVSVSGALDDSQASASGTLRASGRSWPLDVRQAGPDETYASVGGPSYRLPLSYQRMLPFLLGVMEGCTQPGGDGGCEGVDWSVPVRSGTAGRLIVGNVSEGPVVGGVSTWQVVGHLGAAAFARLRDASIRDYKPYERASRIVLTVGRDDLLPRRLEISWTLRKAAIAQHEECDHDSGYCPPVIRQSVRLRVDFSRWGEPAGVVAPARFSTNELGLAPVEAELMRALGPYGSA